MKLKYLNTLTVGALASAALICAMQPSYAAEDKTINIGTVLAMTGPGAFYGKVMSQGEKLAIDEVNSSGELDGYKLALRIEDHKGGDSKAANSGMRKLVSIDKTPVVLSSYGGVTLAIQPLADRQNVLLFNGGGTASTLIGKKSLYNTRMVASQLAPIAVKWAVEELGAKKIGTIYYTDSSGTETNDAVKEACKEMGCEVIIEEPYKIGSTDYSVSLSRVKSANPDAVILGSWGADVGHIIKQAREKNISADLVGLELLSNELEIAGKNMDGYTAIFDSFDPKNDDELTQKFVKAYEDKYGEEPGYYEANYYELIKYVVTPIIQKVIADGGDPTQIGTLNDMMKTLIDEGHQFDSVYGGKLQLHEDGSVTKPVSVYKVEDGEAVNIAKVDGDGFQRINNK